MSCSKNVENQFWPVLKYVKNYAEFESAGHFAWNLQKWWVFDNFNFWHFLYFCIFFIFWGRRHEALAFKYDAKRSQIYIKRIQFDSGAKSIQKAARMATRKVIRKKDRSESGRRPPPHSSELLGPTPSDRDNGNPVHALREKCVCVCVCDLLFSDW